MNAVKAMWTNGHIVPVRTVSWPEGTSLDVTESPATRKFGLDESEWDDSPEGIADFCQWVDTIRPLVFSEEERKANDEWNRRFREFNRADILAIPQ